MFLRDWYEMFPLVLPCTLCSSCFFHVSAWIALFTGHFTTTIYLINCSIHCLSLSVANNTTCFFLFFKSTGLLKEGRKEEKSTSKLEAYARRRRDEKRLTDHQENRRENGEGRIESRANSVLRTGLSDCLESPRQLLSLRCGALSGPCKTAQAA